MQSHMNIVVSAQGTLTLGNKQYPCALGRSGVSEEKREGDGMTPVGCFPLREVLYRADRVAAPETALPTSALAENDGWCDDSADPNYNKRVSLPYSASHERLWREDSVYDIIVPLGYNDDPAIPGKGSAIFLHIARPNYSPTAGCVALALPDLIQILKEVSPGTMLCVTA